MARELHELQQSLGGAEVVTTELLTEAMTHRSFAVENQLDYDNQRLEFLGDAVLEIALTDYLFRLYPASDEGELTKIRSALVRESTLARLSRALRLGEYIRCGKGELDCRGNDRDSTLADLFEALLGAVYLSGGTDKARAFTLAQFNAHYPDPRKMLAVINPKGMLQELSQRRWGQTPEYSVLNVSGPEHLPEYKVEVRLREFVAVGRAANRRNAESAAARTLLEFLQAKSDGTV